MLQVLKPQIVADASNYKTIQKLERVVRKKSLFTIGEKGFLN
jgi:hypothetical protein